MRKFFLIVCVLCLAGSSCKTDVRYSSKREAGEACMVRQDGQYVLKNRLLGVGYMEKEGKVSFGGSKALGLAGYKDLFRVELRDGKVVRSSEMEGRIAPEWNKGEVCLNMQFVGDGLRVDCKVRLKEGCHYYRMEYGVVADSGVVIERVVPLLAKSRRGGPLPWVAGNTRGSVVVSDRMFAAVESPLATTEIDSRRRMIVGALNRESIATEDDTLRMSCVVGKVERGQLRRSFLAYHERERAVGWRSFVLYNSWYELNIDRNNDKDPAKRMREEQCLLVLRAWEEHLYKSCGIGVDAFVWDDGWDDFNSLWDFHKCFPHGFDSLNVYAGRQNAGIGVWLGPVGGYGESKRQRLAYWNSTYNDTLTNFKLSNGVYFDKFVGRCSQMMRDYDMRYFKFDGVSDLIVAAGPKAEADAAWFIEVLKRVREQRGDVFLNCTVGTWASPFWLQYGDAVWRQGSDWKMVGDQGDERERWMTYRDNRTYETFVESGSLCPINSIMNHGFIVTKHGPPAVMAHDDSAGTLHEIVKDMRCLFASGSSMVELYVDNDLMSGIGGNDTLWHELANCIRWYRGRATVLSDTHWVGGKPWDGERANVYGWGAWSEDGCVLTLRNPSGEKRMFRTTLRKALDLPKYVKGRVLLRDAFAGQVKVDGVTGKSVDVDEILTFRLPPFEVVTLEGGAVSK